MITWTLDINEANFILGLLGKQPYEQVAALINKLATQTTASLNPTPPKVVPPPPPS